MWQADKQILSKNIHQYILKNGEATLKLKDFIRLLQESQIFRAYFNQLLADSPFDAFFWECRPFSLKSLSAPFEFVLIRNRKLSLTEASPDAFSRYFSEAKRVVGFSNLSGDAYLLVPKPEGSLNQYTHLATFVRKGAPEQQQALWEALGIWLNQHVSQAPVWLSTSGLGVHWLHIRLDSYAKYYQYEPYRKFRLAN
ncbi:hypothetical protein PZB74_10530 [Porifericola rhodea]|uniref:DUF6940 family protein n=1 Tax=Porifericola rhodea TaxID=930972 RepID=UPI0026669DD2|nr:hypothetical protein [Porifericola rhodea]WKN33760.1 hypothetical protein PZB74_10530 [Porifericola rhodea]